MDWNGILFFHEFLKGTDCLSPTSAHRPSDPNPPDLDTLLLTLAPDLDPTLWPPIMTLTMTPRPWCLTLTPDLDHNLDPDLGPQTLTPTLTPNLDLSPDLDPWPRPQPWPLPRLDPMTYTLFLTTDLDPRPCDLRSWPWPGPHDLDPWPWPRTWPQPWPPTLTPPQTLTPWPLPWPWSPTLTPYLDQLGLGRGSRSGQGSRLWVNVGEESRYGVKGGGSRLWVKVRVKVGVGLGSSSGGQGRGSWFGSRGWSQGAVGLSGGGLRWKEKKFW